MYEISSIYFDSRKLEMMQIFEVVFDKIIVDKICVTLISYSENDKSSSSI